MKRGSIAHRPVASASAWRSGPARRVASVGESPISLPADRLHRLRLSRDGSGGYNQDNRPPRGPRARRAGDGDNMPTLRLAGRLLDSALVLLIVSVVATGPTVATGAAPDGGRRTMLVDFETGSAPLTSYEDEDFDPDAWEIQSVNTYGDTDYALRIWGNSWKELAVDPYPLSLESVFEAAIYTAERGELHAFAFGDTSENVLFYCVHGEQLVLSDRWNVVYQGLHPLEEWHVYRLPVGQDWYDTWGYVPEITRVVFVNDHDDTSDGETFFDEIYDVTDELPAPPVVQIQQIVQGVEALAPSGAAGPRLYRVSVQFQALVEDPDSDTHTYRWEFGDGASSDLPDPLHEFTAEADYQFTVSLDVADDTGLFGRDTCQVTVEPSGEGAVHSINFTGDVFMGRRYDQEGGLIDTYGVEYLWEPTRGILGEAADVTMVNAECPFTERGEEHPTKAVVFRTRPQNVDGLTYAGVDIASTGNNHIIDYGLVGLEDTHAVFDSAGIVHGGSGANDYFALQPCYYTHQGVRLGFINFCNRTGRRYNEQPFFDAGCDKYGLGWWLEPHNQRAIAQAESLADIVIAFPHSGEEYQTSPPREGHGGASATPTDVELCPPYVPADQAHDFKFRIWPGMEDRQLRYHAIDCGADAVLNSHPHVLQGFEVYEGCLIAHSLGNFMFDLYYPETMPTIVLRARFDKQGILSWTFKPVFIDDYIPRPASGQLGREILDRLADYSRELGTLVGVDPAQMLGRIFLDPDQAVPVTTESDGAAPWRPEEEAWVSGPIELAGNGNLDQILDVQGGVPGASWIRVGREIGWFGGFEYDEGHSMWNLNSEDEWLDETDPLAGRYRLMLHRNEHAGDNVMTILSRHWPAVDSLDYSVAGWMGTENAEDAHFCLRFFESRYDWNHFEQFDMGVPVDGTTPWTYYSRDCSAPDGANYVNLRCSLDVPADGDGYAWFDELRLIEWLEWQPLTVPLDLPCPNNFRFVQLRTEAADDSVWVAYSETAYTDGGFSGISDRPATSPVRVHWAGSAPNPCRGETSLRYRLSAQARVDLEVFDVAGRRVANLVQNEAQRPGWHRVSWVAQSLPAGLYFSRLRVDGTPYTRKLVVVR
ncbi:MAG: T9SS type A sorting domain-containing protein [Candidatus Eisenbacteria bacterium]|nr:T9SS type A sorting domain-containing protein [Candidatus Eisenbacteria bacterium]